MKKPLNTYHQGQKVKVDRGGAGLGTQFLTIKDGFETDNVNGYKDYTFEETGDELKICEYYIRPIKKTDIKARELFEKTGAAEFEFDYDDVQKNFWESQRDNIKKVTNYINDFLTPYLLTYGHVLPVDKMTDWDSYYKKGMHTKNRYIFLIPHPLFNIVVYNGTTFNTVFFTFPEDKWELKEGNKKSILFVAEMGTEYSDDEYKNDMTKLTQRLISEFEKQFDKGYFHDPHISDLGKVNFYKHFLVRGNYNDWQTPIPSNYTFALRELNYLKHYVFNKGFE